MAKDNQSQRIAALVARGIEALGSVGKLAQASGLSGNALIAWRDGRVAVFRPDNLAKLARGLRKAGIEVSVEFLQTGRADEADLPAVGYDSLRTFLEEAGGQVSAREVAVLDSIDFGADGDIATPDWWASQLILYRRALQAAATAANAPAATPANHAKK